MRARACSEPDFGGNDQCAGNATEVEGCNSAECPGRLTQWLPDLPGKVLNFGVSVGCLEGVWKVSGGCLGDSGYCLVYWLSNKNHIWS